MKNSSRERRFEACVLILLLQLCLPFVRIFSVLLREKSLRESVVYLACAIFVLRQCLMSGTRLPTRLEFDTLFKSEIRKQQIIFSHPSDVRALRVTEKQNRVPSLKSVAAFADLWGLELRKRIKSMAGDYDIEIRRIHKEKRYRMAKWNKVLAWGYAIWYVLRGPYDLVRGALVKAMKGL